MLREDSAALHRCGSFEAAGVEVRVARAVGLALVELGFLGEDAIGMPAARGAVDVTVYDLCFGMVLSVRVIIQGIEEKWV